jgi:hypothetical protein
MKPFEAYPNQGCEKLGPCQGAVCRREYGLKFQHITGQTHCAYCGLDLTDDYHHWLLLSIDHVVPVAEASRLKIPAVFISDCINKVLCCLGCNGFDNRFKIPDEWDVRQDEDWSLEEFVDLRDRVFEERSRRISNRRQVEIEFFEKKLWLL